MILLLVACFFVLLCLVTLVQTLYLESLRLRTRDLPALEYFRDELEAALGMETDPGALSFSLLKHSLLVLCGSALLWAALAPGFTWARLVEGFVIPWLVMLASSYVAPQILLRRTRCRWLAPLVPLLRLMSLAMWPGVRLLLFMESLYELSTPQNGEPKPGNPQDDIDAFFSAGEEEGLFEKKDSQLMVNALTFGDKRLREVMTPRRRITAVSLDATIDELLRASFSAGVSRVPVYDATLDNIVGFVHFREVFRSDAWRRRRSTLRELRQPLLREIVAVPESKLASELFREMQRDARHIVYVVDEYGSVAGIVTMEDLIEEVLGEIRDEYEIEMDFKLLPDGTLEAPGDFDLDNLREYLDYRPPPGTQSSTLGGLAIEWSGRVPAQDSVIEKNGLSLTILKADALGVDRVLVKRLPEEGGARESNGT